MPRPTSSNGAVWHRVYAGSLCWIYIHQRENLDWQSLTTLVLCMQHRETKEVQGCELRTVGSAGGYIIPPGNVIAKGEAHTVNFSLGMD